jgi:hypothetical protein
MSTGNWLSTYSASYCWIFQKKSVNYSVNYQPSYVPQHARVKQLCLAHSIGTS